MLVSLFNLGLYPERKHWSDPDLFCMGRQSGKERGGCQCQNVWRRKKRIKVSLWVRRDATHLLLRTMNHCRGNPTPPPKKTSLALTYPGKPLTFLGHNKEAEPLFDWCLPAHGGKFAWHPDFCCCCLKWKMHSASFYVFRPSLEYTACSK